MKQRFSVKADVAGVGHIQHIIRAKDADAAFERLTRAYPNRAITTFKALCAGHQDTEEAS
ncbi:hypothetical protein [uncultured Ruegeria sp.]|uniref:hypothetical protein n=1 Tax=uncultured Ruegeria sp. TaxID=259304 RepID=UPI00261161EB|nr:hypothetical protein [uncultured Ruegeria sp.]